MDKLTPEQKRRISGMKCPKCKGYMIYDKFFGEDGSFWGWKCINCGKIIDQVILQNRPLGNQIDDLFNQFTKRKENKGEETDTED